MVVIALFVMTFIVQAFEIPSPSMENTLLVGDYLLVDKFDYVNAGIWSHILPYTTVQRGDIVVFHYPIDPTQHFVKRVIGLPGDHVHLNNKQVWVNGRMLLENYTVYRSITPDQFRDNFPALQYISGSVEPRWWLQLRSLVHNGELVVPPGKYFVMGDNRDDSSDSRYWGFVPAENIVGRPLLIYWSVNKSDSDQNSSTQDAKLGRMFDGIRKMLSNTRWDRTFSIIK